MTATPLQGTLNISTSSSMILMDITSQVEEALRYADFKRGVCYLFNPHTTAGLTINEGADPDVQRDIIKGLQNIVPNNLDYKHMEGNSPSHLMATLTGSSLTILVENHQLLLGTWQKIFFCEFDGPRTRNVIYRFT